MTTALSFISPAVNKNNGTVLVRALLPGGGRLRPGQFIQLRIVTAVHTNCLVAPAECVVMDESGQSVIALVKGEAATQTTVTTGLREEGLIEIEGAGVKEGDTVVTVGAYGLPAQTKIRVENPVVDPAAGETSKTNSH